jgi:hypothetical protein
LSLDGSSADDFPTDDEESAVAWRELQGLNLDAATNGDGLPATTLKQPTQPAIFLT